MPNTDSVQKWMTEVTEVVTTNNLRLEAVEKSTDANTKTAERAIAALERLAKAEEDRNALDKEARQAAKDATDRRDRWMERLWNSPQFQMVFTGLAIVAMNLVGLAGLAHYYLPAAPPP